MDMQHPIAYQLNLVAAQAKLLAGLMLNVTDPREVEHDALALVLQDLAIRLERLGEVSECGGNCPHPDREGRR